MPLKEFTAEVHRYAERYEQFVVLVCDLSGTVLESNPFAAELFGRPPENEQLQQLITGMQSILDAEQPVDMQVSNRLTHITSTDGQAQELYVDVMSDGKQLLCIGRLDLSAMLQQRRVMLDLQDDLLHRSRDGLKQSFLNLQKLEHQHQMILDAAGDGVFGLDREGRHTFVNPAAAEMLGYSIEELIGEKSHSVWHHHHPDGSSYPETDCPVYQVLREGVTHQGSEFFIRRDGEFFPVEFISTPLIERQEIVGAVVIFRDITARLEAERIERRQREEIEALYQQEQQLVRLLRITADVNQLLISSSSQGDLLKSTCHILAEADPFFFSWTWIEGEDASIASSAKPDSPGQVLQQELKQLGFPFHPDEPFLQACYRDQGVASIEIPVPGKGSCWLAAAPLISEVGRDALGVFGVAATRPFEDRELLMLRELGGDIGFAISNFRRQAKLIESEARFRATFNQAAVGIARIGMEGQWLEVNDKLLEIIGYDRRELEKMDFQQFFCIDGSAMEPVPLQLLLDSEEQSLSRELSFIHKLGQKRWLNLTLSIVLGSDDEPGYYVALVEDISKRKRQSQMLELQAKKSEAMLQLPLLAETLPETEFIQKGMELIEDLTGSRIAFIHFVNDDEKTIELVTWSRRTLQEYCKAAFDRHYPLEQAGVWADALRRREPVLINDYPTYPKKHGLPEGHAELMRLISVPVIEHGKVVMLAGVGNRATDYTSVEVEITQLISNELWRIVQRRRGEHKQRQAAEVFSSTVEGVVITDLDGAIQDVNAAFESITGYSKEEVFGKTPAMLQSGRHDRLFYQSMWRSLQEAGEWRGEIWNRRKNGTIYPELLTINAVKNEQGDKAGYVGVFSDITEMKQSEERLDFLAHHDPLTELPNRLLLNARLRQSIKHSKRQGGQLAVVFIDLDRFKYINDSLGHTAGDELLVILAQRLRGMVRSDDTVARVSGDEFVLILEDIGSVEQVLVVIDKLLGRISEPVLLGQDKLVVTASVGVSLFPQDGEEATALMRNADAAMNRSKEYGSNTYQFYTEEMTTAAFEHMFLEHALREAAKQGEFRLVYQPQKELNTDRYIGIEALIRWHHPQQGVISPGRFIPFVEQTSLIKDIGYWVLQTACEQGRSWLEQGIEFGRIAVNIAVLQLQDEGFVSLVKDVLASTRLPAEHLEFEVTEGFVMNQPEQAIERLTALRSLGIEIAIDDFGTGYSSLSYLKRLPLDKLKIDQSFVREIPNDSNDMAIAESVIALGNAMGLRVIAEGVETQAQVEFLLEKGCVEGQGYLFSRPIPSDLVPSFFDPADQ